MPVKVEVLRREGGVTRCLSVAHPLICSVEEGELEGNTNLLAVQGRGRHTGPGNIALQRLP